MIVAGLVSLLPCMFWQTLRLGRVRIQSIVIFKAYITLVPLTFIIGIPLEAWKSIKESRTNRDLGAAIYYVAIYGCAFLFCLSLESALVSILLGRDPSEWSRKVTAHTAMLMAAFFAIFGLVATICLAIGTLRIAAGLMRNRRYFLGSLLGLAGAGALCLVLLVGYLELWKW